MYVTIDEVLAGRFACGRETKKNGKWRSRPRPFSAPTSGRASSIVEIRAACQQRPESSKGRRKVHTGMVGDRNRNLPVGLYHSGGTLPSGRKNGQLKRSVGIESTSVGTGVSQSQCRPGGYGGEKKEETGGAYACLHSRLIEVRSRRLRSLFSTHRYRVVSVC